MVNQRKYREMRGRQDVISGKEISALGKDESPCALGKISSNLPIRAPKNPIKEVIRNMPTKKWGYNQTGICKGNGQKDRDEEKLSSAGCGAIAEGGARNSFSGNAQEPAASLTKDGVQKRSAESFPHLENYPHKQRFSHPR